MQYGRHYLVVTVLSWLIVLLIGGYGAGEIKRQEMAEERQTKESLERGLELYARNCSTCHGPSGEGCVGAPLNREDYRGEPGKNKNVADMLHQTISKGRAGTGVPRWVKTSDGQWASYTAMPAWHKDSGGPLNDMHINDLVNFIMMGDYGQVLAKIKAIEAETEEAMKKGNPPIDPLTLPMRDAPGLSPVANKKAQEIFTAKGCVGCHRIGSRGSSVGPDLSFVGSWGLDREFLKAWIKEPSKVANRTPIYFTNYGPELDLSSKRAVQPGPTVMPPLGLTMTEDELNTLVDYLIALRVQTKK